MKETRKYSLFEKREGKWVRISELAYKKSTAIRVFQSALLAYAFGHSQYVRELRPVKE